METAYSYSGGDFAYFSSDERKWKDRIKKMAAEHPDEVTVIRQPEENDGCIYVKLPVNWINIKPKRHRFVSDEERTALIERLAKLRAAAP